jgi:hypothetical protein
MDNAMVAAIFVRDHRDEGLILTGTLVHRDFNAGQKYTQGNG